jgi:transcriptional regulator with PAS, ATPase and Fis domain
MRNQIDPNHSLVKCIKQFEFNGLIGESASMRRVYELIQKMSQSFSSVLLLGESGTGKEVVARCIHSMGPRCEKVLVPVDCSALCSTVIESELFGHVKGSFTGANCPKRGLFEAANEGTIFLDEIGELPAGSQAKMLRVLQQKEIRPVGSTQRVSVNIRVIAATNHDLEKDVQAGTFRQDLYFRLNVVQISLPPLRQRPTDIPLLVNHFLEKYSDHAQPARTISKQALQMLMIYNWPGNVRELENVIERAVALGCGPTLDVGDLPPALHSAGAPWVLQENDLFRLKVVERRVIFQAVRETRGDKVAAANLLGIGKTTLYRKLKEYSWDAS